MPNLKMISMRLKSVTNIQKITMSMKMVSAAKYARAERDLKVARPLGMAAQHFYSQAEVGCEKEAAKEVYVTITSDRGLAGGVHSNISKAIRNEMEEKTPEQQANTRIICVGDKSRAFMARYFPAQTILVGSEIGRLPPQMGDAAAVASAIITCGFEFDQGKMIFNYYKSVVSYDTKAIQLFSLESVMAGEKMSAYDSVDADVLQSYTEFSLASLVYYAMKEGATSEQSSRMTAMDNSTKNAGEMIDKLRITFNRTRQAVITGELIEIISGAAAL